MSSHVTELAELGAICCGLVRGISFSVRHTRNTSRPRKRIGSHVIAHRSMSS
jgi:hypothetical protein